ncbi:MAG: hypothetical protein JWM80_5906 [Cyanobacteria bacterium RYN_339]|nr:hypothetical protein [Cyanobacteria bacterium RYN_339]
MVVAFFGMATAASWRYLALPFVAYGLNYAVRWAHMRGTRYGLTETHAVIVESFPRRRATRIALASLDGVYLNPEPGHRGTIQLGTAGKAMEHVERPRVVYDQARQAIGEEVDAPPVAAVYVKPKIGVGQILAALFLLWLAVFFLQLGTVPLMGG